jgi:uncharacterized OB-fold protein
MPTSEPGNLVRCSVQQGVQALADEYRAVIGLHQVPLAQRCEECQTAQFPPMLACPSCGSDSLWWVDAGPTGTVGTYVTVHTRDATPSMSIPRRLLDSVPYTSVYVNPDALPTVRLAALMVGDQQAELHVGSRVTFDAADPSVLKVSLEP